MEMIKWNRNVFYVISGNFICLSFQKYIIKDTFVFYSLKVLLCNM